MTLSTDLPFSPACERNKTPILSVISECLSGAKTVLEIGSGTAQHAIHFGLACPQLHWQTSDQACYLDGIRAQLNHANVKNVAYPIELDVNQEQWLSNEQHFDVVYSANTLHIMSDADVAAFFQGLSQVSTVGSYLIVYGPFKYQGRFTSASNAEFDLSLRSRGCGSLIKEFDDVNALAQKQGFELVRDQSMPANNQCVFWQRV